MNTPNLSEIAAFLAVADRGGFAAAARELGVTQSTISRRIAALEAKLGERLVMRTTRKVALTDAGGRYAHELRDVLANLRDAHARVRNRAAEPDGLVRITMPTALGRTRVLPVIETLAARHPRLRFDLDLSDRYVDLLEGDFDIAIRLSDAIRSGLQTERVGSFKVGLYASAAYAGSVGLPATPADLAAHRVLALRTYGPRTEWNASWQDRPVTIQVSPVITVTDSFALKALALAGLGIAVLPAYLIDDECRSGRLVDVLAALAFPPRDVFLAYLPHRADLTKVETVLAALRRAFRR